jgi:glycerophosphoryl diester phosphodiesterase
VRRLILALLALAFAAPVAAQDVLIIAHRGASGERPEHTLAAYERAIDLGADYVEPDLVATRDGVLVARHENEISGTTDVATRPEFADRRTTRMIDGMEMTGWFTEDFTLAELRSLRARERLPQLRPENTRFDGLYPVPTLAEVIALVRAKEAETGRTIGLYPEIKHPTYFASIGHDLAAMLVTELHAAGYRDASAPVFIQSFEVDPLVRLNGMTELRLVQLMAADGGPADRPDVTYAAMIAGDGLRYVRGYADGIGAEIRLILDPQGAPTGLVAAAHEAGLLVHAWTLRRENVFMPRIFASNDNPTGLGGLPPLMGALVAAGVDGIFTDHPGVTALRDSGNYEP